MKHFSVSQANQLSVRSAFIKNLISDHITLLSLCSLYSQSTQLKLRVNFPDLGDNTVQNLFSVDAFWNNAERHIRKVPTGTSYAVKI